MFAALFAWPWLRTNNRKRALTWLVAAHVSPFHWAQFSGTWGCLDIAAKSMVRACGYGDLVAGLLAIIATVALACAARWARGQYGPSTFGAPQTSCSPSVKEPTCSWIPAH